MSERSKLFCIKDIVWERLRIVELVEEIGSTGTFNILGRVYKSAGIEGTTSGTLGTTIEGLG